MIKKIIPFICAALFSAMCGAAAPSLPSPVEFAVQLELKNIQQAKEWLDQGLPVNFQGSRIGSGVHIGAWEGYIEMMELFLQRGANINQLNGVGETPAAIAAWKGQQKALEWLLERGASVNTPNKTWSPLHYAVFAGHADTADFLLKRGANINALSTNGSTPLMMAIYEGKTELAKKLINLGADIRPKNDWNEGAFEWAMKFGNLEIAKTISSPQEFAEAMNKPKSSWGTPNRSVKPSPELEKLLKERQYLLDTGKNIEHLQKPILQARMRMIEQKQENSGVQMVFEITADRKNPSQQKAKITEYNTPGLHFVPKR